MIELLSDLNPKPMGLITRIYLLRQLDHADKEPNPNESEEARRREPGPGRSRYSARRVATT